MNNIDPSSNRSSFFPKSRGAKSNPRPSLHRPGDIGQIDRNSLEKQQYIKTLTKNDAKVDINSRVKDFARIKSAVDRAPDLDNSAKVAALKQQIANGTYNINYDALAEKMLQSEF